MMKGPVEGPTLPKVHGVYPGPKEAPQFDQKSPNCPTDLKKLAYTRTCMEEQWAHDLEYKAKVEQEYEPLITLPSKSWYSNEAWLAHFEAGFASSLPW